MTHGPNWLNTTLNFPLSGGVSQRIAPIFDMADYHGEPRIEQRILTDVAGYGSQLGTTLDALCFLAPKTDARFARLHSIKDRIDAVKKAFEDDHERDAIDALERLRQSDPERWRKLIAAQAQI